MGLLLREGEEGRREEREGKAHVRTSFGDCSFRVPAPKSGTLSLRLSSGAARGRGRGKLPPYGWTSKNYVVCVCFHCHGTSSYHTTNTLQGRRAKSHVDTTGTGGLRTLDPL